MIIPLKHKYTVYNGDKQIGSDWRPNGTQYGNGRSGNGNGKRPKPTHVTEAFQADAAKLSKATQRPVKTMVVNALTGHKVMEVIK